MLWLIAIISAYLLLAVVALIDRYLLAGKPDPKVYAFYVGLLSLLLLLVIKDLFFLRYYIQLIYTKALKTHIQLFFSVKSYMNKTVLPIYLKANL